MKCFIFVRQKSYFSKVCLSFLFLVFGLFPLAASAAPGDVDLGFSAGAIVHSTENARVTAIAVQSDNKVIIGGIFTSVGGAARNAIARLNADGSLDTSFNAPLQTVGNLSPSVLAIALQPDGKILVGGAFYVNGDFTIMVRLNADGSLDSSFSVSASNNSVSVIRLQPDGKILVGGNFGLISNTACPNLARLNANGSLDTNLGAVAGIASNVDAIALQPDAKIVIGGGFIIPGSTRARLTRLNPDGTQDATFNVGNGANSDVYSLAVQLDGKILVGGFFSNVSGRARNALARLNADGTIDAAFAPTLFSGSIVYSMFVQPDGKIFIVGNFGVVNGSVRVHLARLNVDGTLDSFYPTGTPSGANNIIWTTARQADNKYLIGGDFTSVAGIARSHLARLLDNPPAQPTTTALSSSLNPSTFGDAVTFTATVSAASGVPDGSVEFFDGAASLGSVALIGGSTSLTTSALAAGTHAITAVYSGSSAFTGSTSPPLVQIVGAVTPVGINVPVTLVVGQTTIRLVFGEITQAGTTVAIPTDPCRGIIPPDPILPGVSCAPTDPCLLIPPPTIFLDANSRFFEINTTAIFNQNPPPITPPVKLAFQMPFVTNPTDFNNLRVVHYTPGDPCAPGSPPPVGRIELTARDFASKTLSVNLASLSPFLIAPTTDTIAPATSAVFSQPPNANGWHKADFNVMLSAADNANGAGAASITYRATGAQTVPETTVAGSSVSIPVNVEGTTQITFYATDFAANVETAQTLTVRLDKTAPIVNLITPPNGASYQLNQAVSANYTCADALSGIASCAGTTANGANIDTASAGGKSFTVNAADQAGNTAAQTNFYTVTSVVNPSDRIVFASTRDGNSEIYTMNADGTNQMRLTFNAAIDANPSWSPDRTKIAFTSFRNGNAEIYTMNADGSNLVRLTNNAAIDDDAAWSPDGSKIAFWSSRSGNAEIYVMNHNGTNQTRLTNNAGTDIQPAWSPDGSRIAFASDRAALLNFDIYVMNANGANVTRLTNGDALDDSPAFSPDGSKIAFASNRTGLLDFEIYAMNADGTNQVQLTSAANTSVQPAWSRDGTKIVFATNRDGLLNFEIYTMNANGGNPVKQTSNAALDFAPNW